MAEPGWRVSLETRSVEETTHLAADLARCLSGGDVLALTGDLGAGKTTFTKGLCAGLGIDDERTVSSPTYVLEHRYSTRVPVIHYDAYRLASAEEFLDLGFDEALQSRDAILVVEWADRVLAAFPSDRLNIALGFSLRGAAADDGHRSIDVFGPVDPWAEKLGEWAARYAADPHARLE